MALRTTSSLPFNTSQDCDSINSLGSPFQCLWRSKFFLTPNLNPSWRSLVLCPLILSFVSTEKRLIPPGYTLLSRTCRVVKSLWNFLFFRLNNSSSLSFSLHNVSVQGKAEGAGAVNSPDSDPSPPSFPFSESFNFKLLKLKPPSTSSPPPKKNKQPKTNWLGNHTIRSSHSLCLLHLSV